MDINYYKQYEPIFGVWHITRLIGEGSFGKVFEMEREDFGVTYKAALKAITVPASETELRDVMADGMDEASVRNYYSTFVQDLVKEFALMSRLKGNSNVVSYENHQVIEHKEGIGWDILIQMELLTPLNEYTRKNAVTRQDVIRLGIDMCKALELCQKYNIIHRDVKPENMFVSDNGDFKLGDFGIARTVEKTTSGLSKKGTYTYMAPEVYKGEAYGSTVDIYSLGIVLYRLLNENRTPFLPAYPAPITHSDRENALAKRFSGAPLPPPSHAEGRLAEIVLKACAYDPKERYSVPLRMREDLEAILYNREESQYIYPEGDEVPQKSVRYVKTGDEPLVAEVDATQKDTGNAPGTGRAAESDFGKDDFGGTTSDFGKPDFSGTVSNFGKSDLGGTVSDFGRVVNGSQESYEDDKTQSDFSRNIKSPEIRTSQKNGAAKKETPKKGGKKLIIGLAAACLAALVITADVVATKRKNEAEALQAAQDAAYKLYEDREYSQCVEYTNDLLNGDYGDNEFFMSVQASAQFELGNYAEAAELYKKLSSNDEYGMTVENLRDYAVCLARLGRLDEAATIFVMLTDQGASADVTSYVLGETYYAKKDYENAAEEFKKVLDSPNEALHRRCYHSLAETYRDAGDYWASIVLLEEAVTKPPMNTDPILYEMLGLAYYQAAQVEGYAYTRLAAEAFDQALTLGMQKDYIYTNAAYAYMLSESYSDAYAVLDRMEQVYPNSYLPHALRAVCCIYEENSKDEIERDYSAAKEEYEIAKSMATSSDDQTYLQMVESLIRELEEKGWL